jgi:hypothetical protein
MVMGRPGGLGDADGANGGPERANGVAARAEIKP